MSVNDLVEFRFLKYFHKIGETRNITEACNLLNVSQLTVSQQIKQMEDILQIKLLVREKTGVSLTAAGEVLWTAAGELLNGRDELIDLLKAINHGSSSTVRLGFSNLVEGHVLEAAKGSIQTIFPSCKVGADFDDVEQLEFRVLNGGLDGALITLPVPQSSDLLVCPVESELLLVCMRADDPLAMQEEIPAHALNGRLSAFAYPKAHPAAYAKLLKMLAEVNVTLKNCNSTTNREHIQWLVLEKHCLAFVRKNSRLSPGLVARPIHGVSWTIDTALIANKTAQHPAIAMLVRDLKKRVGSLPQLLPWKKAPQSVEETRREDRRSRRGAEQSMPLFGTGS